jgi:hypothetical protein
MKITGIIIGIFCFLSCGVPQGKYDDLKAENERLQKRNQELMDENASIEAANSKQQKSYTEEDVLRLLKDWYSFYNADFVFRKPKIRRISNSDFVISLEECTKQAAFKNDNFYWNSAVLYMKFNEDGNYNISRR